MVHIVKMDRELIPYVYKLFPHYKILKALPPEYSTNFIISHNISFVLDIEKFKIQYEDAVILSELIAEKEWTKETILDMAVYRAQEWKISRRQKPRIIDYDFEASFQYTLFGHADIDEYETDKKLIFAIFDALGTDSFRRAFIKATNEIPTNRLIKSTRTYINKVEQLKIRRKIDVGETIRKNRGVVQMSGNHLLDFVEYVERLTTQ